MQSPGAIAALVFALWQVTDRLVQRFINGRRPMPTLPRHSNPLLPLLPSGPGGVHNFTLRGDRQEPP